MYELFLVILFEGHVEHDVLQIHILKMHKIICSVSENKSIQCDKSNCWIEYGCRITTSLKPELIKKDIFNPLKKELDLGCGHIEVRGDYRGCINEFNN